MPSSVFQARSRTGDDDATKNRVIVVPVRSFFLGGGRIVSCVYSDRWQKNKFNEAFPVNNKLNDALTVTNKLNDNAFLFGGN